ncbi:VWA2 [Branchiostoma lanceolatum]|uniref:VWA2 protein n=1 Tax=Branchiostoma lanceolatum TaxID=7740 RepID=A0A8J9Z4S5_BRALA|nr:VWA2 [Branchiostoma lanceolatum]
MLGKLLLTTAAVLAGFGGGASAQREVPDCGDGTWTQWFDRDNPSVTGDWETLTSLRKENPGRICFNPSAVHARVISTQVEASLAGEVLFRYDTASGFVCRKIDQDDNTCLEYEVRFCCPPCPRYTNWFDRDNPSATGDWEVLSHLRPENPGQICLAPTDIQVRVKGTEQPAFMTGEVFAFYDVSTGFVCRKEDQPDNTCLDYEVRFCCPRTCARWTQWFDRDNPSGVGDWESLYGLVNGNPVGLRPEYPGKICPMPTDVHARVIATQQEASLTGETFVYYDTANGFACRNQQQRDGRCLDYEVRFCCPDPYCPNGDKPLPDWHCGRGGERCPTTHYCEIEPADAWAVCCPREVPLPLPKEWVCSIDLVLVVDLSSSLTEPGFFSLKRFIIDLILCFIELCVDAQIGIITYDCVPSTYLPVCTYPTDDPTLLDTVNCLTYTGSGGSRTGHAIRYMTDTSDFRDGFARAAVVMTDAHSDDDSVAQADMARASGIDVYGVGTGHPLLVNMAALEAIAGDADRVVLSGEPACKLVAQITRDLCGI